MTDTNDLKITVVGRTFEAIKHDDGKGDFFWFASELMEKLEYEKWDKFLLLIERAMAACEKSGFKVEDHFLQVGKMVKLGSGAERIVVDYALTRYACYLIAQNGDPTKKERVAWAQSYFAYQTRKQEIQQQNFEELERILARQKLTETEKEFAAVMFSKGINGKGVATIRSAGDQVLFGGKSTQQMKEKYGVKGNRPLADFLPTLTLKAKDLAAEMTTFKTKEKGLRSSLQIKDTHINHNRSVRKVLTDEGIFPEQLPPAEDIKKLERRIKKEDQGKLKNSEKPLKIEAPFDKAMKAITEKRS